MTRVDVVHADPSSRTVVRIKQSSQLNQPAAQEVKRSTLQLVLVQVVVKLTYRMICWTPQDADVQTLVNRLILSFVKICNLSIIQFQKKQIPS
jgi:hypothetical protein